MLPAERQWRHEIGRRPKDILLAFEGLPTIGQRALQVAEREHRLSQQLLRLGEGVVVPEDRELRRRRPAEHDVADRRDAQLALGVLGDG